MSGADGSRPSRRQVLGAVPAAVLAAALASCTQDTPPAEPVPVDPDVALRDAAVARERALLRAYDDVLAGRPELGSRLLPLRDQHAAHLSALLGASASAGPSDGPSAAASGAAPPAAAAPPSVPPAPPAAALAALAAQERSAGDAHAAASLAASRTLAGLLSSLSASELSHPLVLR